MRRSLSIAAVALLLLAACAKNSTSGAGPGSGSGTGTVKTVSVAGVGTVLVDGKSGKTLYLLSAEAGGKVTCGTGACASIWPPLLLPSGTSKPTAGSGVDASLLGTANLPSGGVEVTYGGFPLHFFAGDTVGQAGGQGIHSFGGVWTAVTSAGKPAQGAGSTSRGGY